MDAIAVSDLTFTYPGCARPALEGVSFSARQGEFIVICGRSGSGKSTLLRHFKSQLAPHGSRSGRVLLEGVPLEKVGLREQAARIGFVLQNPDNQIVTESVAHELAFGLENLGAPSGVIRLRMAEMASFFGIADWFYEGVQNLSGGQKQLVNLAAVMALQPSLLVLDEPTAQLDPIAATDFLNTVRRINRELGTTVLLSEQRLEEALPLSDRVLALEAGRVRSFGTPREVCRSLSSAGSDMFCAMPTPARIYDAVERGGSDGPDGGVPPLTVREGRSWLGARMAKGKATAAGTADGPAPRAADGCPAGGVTRGRDAVIELKGVWFRYGRSAPDVLRGLDLSVERATWHCLLGANGAGKSTTLGVMAGLDRPYRGRVLYDGRPVGSYPRGSLYRGNVGVLPQNPQTLFVEKTVRLDLAEALPASSADGAHPDSMLERVCELTQIGHLLDMHPFDLSGGEQQRVALAKVLLREPRVLLLDEPTKGLDAPFKLKLAEVLHRLQDGGTTVIMVSHDIEFCARHADACSLLFRGEVVRTDEARAFFAGNSFYTTAANRMARGLVPGAVLDEDVIEACRTR